MHTGIKQIYRYSSCLSSHQSSGKALRNSWVHAALQTDHKYQEQDCWCWHAKSEKWLPSPLLLCMSQQSQPWHFRLKRHSAATRRLYWLSGELLEESGSGMKCICSRSKSSSLVIVQERSERTQHWLQGGKHTWGNCLCLSGWYKSPTVFWNANSADHTVSLCSWQQQDHL